MIWLQKRCTGVSRQAIIVVCLVVLYGCTETARDAPAESGVIGNAGWVSDGPGTYIGQFSPSFYQIVDESAGEFSRGRKSRAVRDRHGRVLARVTPTFFRRLNIEGCGRLASGRVLTYDTRVNGVIRFRLTGHAYGLAHGDVPLVPYRTVAVDSSVVPLGSIVYIPCIRGVELPDGSTHDGFFHAHDIGSGIRGPRIDFFVGFEDHIHNTFTRTQRLTHGVPVDAYLVHKDTMHEVPADSVR